MSGGLINVTRRLKVCLC